MTQRWERAWHAQGSARGGCGSEGVRVGGQWVREPWWGTSVDEDSLEGGDVSVSACFLDKLLNSYLSSKEEYLPHTFSQLTYFYFCQSSPVLFNLVVLSCLFKILLSSLRKKKSHFFLSVVFSSVMPNMTLITQS